MTAEDLFDCLFWLGPGTPRGRLHAEALSAVTWPEPDASACCVKDQLRVDADPGFAGPERRPVADELQRPAWWQRPRGGGGTSHCEQSRWWAWPLPPSGPLEFICHWPALGTGETRVGIDAQLILDAARRSIRLWPEDG